MENGYSQKLIESYVKLANNTLNTAYSNFKASDFRVASSLAYYAMFYSANAAILKVGVKPPKTHQGVLSLFSKYYVKTGKIDGKFSKYLKKASDIRQISSYDVLAEISEKDTVITLDNAKEFVMAVRKVISYS
jgi:hypothetical protein